MTPRAFLARVAELAGRVPPADHDRVLADLQRYAPTADGPPLDVRADGGTADRPPPPWTADDLRLAAAAHGWPTIQLDGRAISGEAAWIARLDTADADERTRLHAALAGDADA